MPLPAIGTRAPWVAGLIDQAGHPVDLHQLAGQDVTLIFFRIDALPVCPVLGCASPGNDPENELVSGRTYGVSLDPDGGSAGFVQRFGEPYDLLIDADGELARAYGVDQRTALPCAVRIGPDGRVLQTWQGMVPAAIDLHGSQR